MCVCSKEKQGEQKTLEKKWVYVLFGWEGRKNNFYVEPTHFLPEYTQNLSLQNGEKTEQGKFESKMTKWTWAKSSCLFFFFLFFSYVVLSNVAFFFLIYFFLLIFQVWCFVFVFFLMVSSATLPPLFFFLLISWAQHFVCVCVSFCLTRNDFFFLIWVFFFFLGCLSLFYFKLSIIF